MTDQLRINDRGEIESQPLTWDGEPVYSPSTVREGLFDPEAFEQIPGQMAMESKSAPLVIGERVLVRDRYLDRWDASEIVAIHNGGSLVEVRNPHAMSNDPGATLRVPADEIRVQP